MAVGVENHAAGLHPIPRVSVVAVLINKAALLAMVTGKPGDAKVTRLAPTASTNPSSVPTLS